MIILIPAAGNGARFVQAGYDKPKPLIDVVGKPMIQRVMDNLRPSCDHKFVIVSQLDDSAICPLLRQQDIHIRLASQTEGAVDTLLRAEQYITNAPLLVANCDQLVDFDVDEFIASAQGLDGSIVTFKSDRPHHSYVQTYVNGIVRSIAEKVVISQHAVTGVYYFTHGNDFVNHAKMVLADNDRYNHEFYVSSVISRMIKGGYRLGTFDAPTGILGTPSELQLFESAVRVGRTL